MPQDTSKSTKLSMPRMLLYLVAAIAVFLVLRFVFSIAMSILKFVALGALAVFVVWLFMGKGGSSKKSG